MKRLFHPQKAAGYRFMVWTFRIMDLFGQPDRRLDDFSIQRAMVVVDYGCGPGRYLRKASGMVGPEGRVYAADINPIAIDIVKKKIQKYKLANVVAVRLENGSRGIDKHVADVVYALDMFHQIDDTAGFLAAIHRITKRDGVLYLEDGHQPRQKTLEKISTSGLWKIAEQSERYVTLSPASNGG